MEAENPVERAFVRRALGACMIVLVALVATAGGRALLYCPAMGKTLSHCCCPATDARDDGPAIERAPCCEARTVTTAPPASTDARSPSWSLAAPVVVAGVAHEAPRVAGARLATAWTFAPGRGGLAPPKTPLHVRHCVHLL